ncbi:MAG: Rpn family recombination-promoting nuclease/putative transposase, partial [Clostridia bacterium]|nr:Rpn family recombination-promoting nuclease/putative transposase [Clostridia bacterium]
MTEELTYLPTNDIMFKLIFGSIGNEKITQKFIESILGKKIKPITLGHKLELEIPSPTSKQMVADVIAKDKEQKKYVLEMQRTKTKGLLQRFLGYDCKLYVSGIKKKEQYDTIKQATLIVIMEEPFPGLEKIKDYHTVIDLAIKAHTEIEFNNVIQLHIIELEKYQEQKKSAGKIE